MQYGSTYFRGKSNTDKPNNCFCYSVTKRKKRKKRRQSVNGHIIFICKVKQVEQVNNDILFTIQNSDSPEGYASPLPV